MSLENTTPKRGRGRPRKDERVDPKVRPTRVPVSGHRDILTVSGKEDGYVYRWVLDKQEDGGRIQKFLNAGYEFVQSDHVGQVGQDDVYQTKNVGSIVRKPSGDGQYLYLMRIDQDWYTEDQTSKERELKIKEGAITRERDPENKGDDGQYGSVKIS